MIRTWPGAIKLREDHFWSKSHFPTIHVQRYSLWKSKTDQKLAHLSFMAPGPERLHCMAISIIMNSRLCPNYILHLTKYKKNQIFCIATSALSLQDQVSRLDKDFHDSSKNISNTHMKILKVLEDWTPSTPTLPRVAYLYSFFVQRGRCLHEFYFPLISR